MTSPSPMHPHSCLSDARVQQALLSGTVALEGIDAFFPVGGKDERWNKTCMQAWKRWQ